MALCQRYYEPGEFIWSGYAASGVWYYTDTTFKATKRVIPTITLDPQGGTGFTSGQGILNSVNTFRVRIAENCDVTGNGNYFVGDYIADAEL